MLESNAVQEEDLLTELDRLEQRLQEITAVVQGLREERRRLEHQCDSLRQECERLRQERSATVGRLTHLIEKVDALRGES